MNSAQPRTASGRRGGWPDGVPTPDEPVRLALVGAGRRARSVYFPLLEALRPWARLTAVCDPVPAARGAAAEALDVPAYDRLDALVRGGVAEAALVLTPPHTHYAVTRFLADRGLHCHTETQWTSLPAQACDLLEVGRQRGVVMTVTENFPRMPADRFAQTVRDSGYLGDIGRVVSYNANANYHNNARWLVFAREHPAWVQAIEHRVAVDLRSTRGGDGDIDDGEERFRARFYGFASGLMVVDQASNTKCLLGRTARPGYEEWHGPRGTLRHAPRRGAPFDGDMTMLRCSDEALGRSARADQVVPVRMDTEGGTWARSVAETLEGPIAYANPLRTDARVGWRAAHHWYGVAVLDHVVDFALAVRGLRTPELTAADALMTVMMEVGAAESALRGGARVELPIGETEAEALERDRLRRQIGVDPSDVEAVLGASFPKGNRSVAT